MTYIAQTYDFYDALKVKQPDLEIKTTSRITDNQYLVETERHGNFVCESFEDDAATIYMKVYNILSKDLNDYPTEEICSNRRK
ncbi:hypothetical protein UFOVP58_6 [uncultured Caudovirales phage]|uniref:Uncharacterized protein n=1 Tax=uncultured Caudovirales phage TaxID=2100421 RepID=A0A6J5KTG3_9CAUD|nr:hypothetical protein UFOVP58_6 [uncultured Caudovirales phage]